MTRTGKPFDESLWQASAGPELVTKLQAEMSQVRLLQAAILDGVSELERQGIPQLAGYPNTQALLVDTLHLAPQQATRMVQRAQAVAETMTPTGHVTPAPLPNVRAALHEGLIDGEHIDAIARTVKQIPDSVDVGVRELVESTLAETARSDNPHTVHRHGEIFLQRLNPDGDQPADDPTTPRNSFSYGRVRNGSMTFRGHLEPHTAELLEQMLDKDATPPADSTLDPRSQDERLGDALADIVHRAANPHGGTRAQLTVLLDLNTLIDGIGTATLESGIPLGPDTVRHLACDADFIPIVLNGRSVPLDAGQTRRLVKPKQRAALIARDRGCAYPGCCNPARWADAHHIKHWIDGGNTDLDNLVLLCRRHHTQLHHSAWQVRLNNGLPEFIPPKWIDPHQQPRRNTVHHLRP